MIDYLVVVVVVVFVTSSLCWLSNCCRSRDLAWRHGKQAWDWKHSIARRQSWYVLQQSVSRQWEHTLIGFMFIRYHFPLLSIGPAGVDPVLAAEPPPLDTWRHTQQQQKRLTWWICTSVTLSNRLSFQLRPTGVSHWSCHEGHVDRTVPVLQKKSLVTCTGLVGACDPRKGVHDTENVLAFYRIVWHIGWICQLRRYAWFYHFNALIWLVGRQEGIRLVKTAPTILRRTRRNVYRRERLRDWLNKNRRRSRISSSYCLFVCLFVC